MEHLAALRAIPNLVVIRPADGNETSQAWKVAIDRKTGPTALVLTRQNVPQITTGKSLLFRGGYILRDSADEDPRVILLATGSEVHIALAAADRLQEEGIGARIVSMPSWELFDAQPEEYRNSVLLKGVPRLSIEAGRTWIWDHYLHSDPGLAIGVDRYGASAPYQVIYEQFGLTAESIARKAKQLLN